MPTGRQPVQRVGKILIYRKSKRHWTDTETVVFCSVVVMRLLCHLSFEQYAQDYIITYFKIIKYPDEKQIGPPEMLQCPTGAMELFFLNVRAVEGVGDVAGNHGNATVGMCTFHRLWRAPHDPQLYF